MLHGVKINGVDTLAEYGLVLLADYSIEAPKRRESRVTVPGMDGSIDLGTALTGQPVYDDRAITFRLFRGVDDAALDDIRTTIMALYHGQTVTVEFPFDEDHVYTGVLQFGAMVSYNSGTIPVSMTAQPWRMRKTTTKVQRSDLGTSYKTIELANEGRPVRPAITCSKETTLLYEGETITVRAGTTNTGLDIVLRPGKNQLKAKVASGTGTITAEYLEGCL